MRGTSCIIVLTSAAAAAMGSASSAASASATASGRPGLLKANPLASKNLSAIPTSRRLEDGAGSIYNSNIQYGRCHRVKVREENDDDGGQNFYGGRYHSKTVAFASFFLCDENDGGMCGSCDHSTEYAMDLNTYLQTQVNFVGNYCDSCAAQCRRRNDEEDGEGDNNNNNGGGNYDGAVDCNSCKQSCKNYNANGDEVNYLYCQAAYVDDDGNQLYSAPTCDTDSGDIIIDMFYDDECQIKHYVGNYYGFSYDTFESIEDMCIDCASSNGVCAEMYEEAYHCVNGNNQNYNIQEDEDVKACKSFNQAFKERTYHKKKKASPIFAFVIFAVTLLGCFGFGSYTYYIRHRPKTSLASLDHGGVPQGELA